MKKLEKRKTEGKERGPMKAIYVIGIKRLKRCYVGQTDDIVRRIKQHETMLRCHKHHARRLQEDYEKYKKIEIISLYNCDSMDIEDRKIFEKVVMKQYYDKGWELYNSQPDHKTLKYDIEFSLNYRISRLIVDTKKAVKEAGLKGTVIREDNDIPDFLKSCKTEEEKYQAIQAFMDDKRKEIKHTKDNPQSKETFEYRLSDGRTCTVEASYEGADLEIGSGARKDRADAGFCNMIAYIDGSEVGRCQNVLTRKRVCDPRNGRGEKISFYSNRDIIKYREWIAKVINENAVK